MRLAYICSTILLTLVSLSSAGSDIACESCTQKLEKTVKMCDKICVNVESDKDANEHCVHCLEGYSSQYLECGKTCAADEKSFKRWMCGAGGGVVGALAPTAVYSALGLSAAGPVAGGIFAGLQGAGLAGGGLLAGLQAAAMTGPLFPVIAGAAALEGVGYIAC